MARKSSSARPKERFIACAWDKAPLSRWSCHVRSWRYRWRSCRNRPRDSFGSTAIAPRCWMWRRAEKRPRTFRSRANLQTRQPSDSANHRCAPISGFSSYATDLDGKRGNSCRREASRSCRCGTIHRPMALSRSAPHRMWRRSMTTSKFACGIFAPVQAWDPRLIPAGRSGRTASTSAQTAVAWERRISWVLR